MHKLGVEFCACLSSLLVRLEKLKKHEVDFTACGEFTALTEVVFNLSSLKMKQPKIGKQKKHPAYLQQVYEMYKTFRGWKQLHHGAYVYTRPVLKSPLYKSFIKMATYY